MRVRCIKTRLDEDERKVKGMAPYASYEFDGKIGDIYTVLGINCNVEAKESISYIMNAIDIHNEPVSNSHLFFEILDPRPSSLWRAKVYPQALDLCPEEFYSDYFFERVCDGKKKEVKIYKEVCRKLELEFHPVRELLINHWDPLNIKEWVGFPSPYDKYVFEIESILKDEDAPIKIYEYLLSVEIEELRTSADVEHLYKVVEVFRKEFNLYP